mmetsp:Transcript_3941/g.9933  ORF Transcript_3941/g.9933 Transcript_3941/m.9933 type:complete len:223 (+) Transcript_3941:356-1024(+)
MATQAQASPFSTVASETYQPSPNKTSPANSSAAVDAPDFRPRRPGFGLPFFRIIGSGMHNFLRLEKRFEFNETWSARLGGSYEIRQQHFYPRAELEYKISDKYGSLLLTESRALYRKDFYPKYKSVSMRIRVQTGAYLTGKPMFPRIDVDEPEPLKLFAGAALIALAIGAPLGASKILPVHSKESPLTKEKAESGLGLKLEAKLQDRALCLTVHQLNGIVSL